MSKINNFYNAEDLCSDVFVKIYEKIDTYDESKSSLSTWIFTITKNTLTDYYRTNHLQVELDENIALEDEEDDEGILTDENLDKLAEALKQLPEKERNIIVMYYYSGYSLKQISEKLSISYAYVKILHKKTLFSLKNYIKL